ncbi:MAG: hypothetical protein QGH39_09665 [Candidatus Thermoplasmatota archaeon]|jgi:hypothetical protein|nr:hypothetical protein [Candidatus Thermoplasmatota archaeon]
MNEYVWYASYGSNLLRERFMCYIKGGRPEGSTTTYKGCTDKQPPLRDKRITIPHELYFAKESDTWENKGVAFIRSTKDSDAKTLGRMYLITREQFTQVVRQENGRDPGHKSIQIDFESTVNNGESLIPIRCWYGRIIYLGDADNEPIFTFTAKREEDKIEPGMKYLSMIKKGLKEAYGISNEEIASYLRKAGA